jgi:hypothetical protein
MTSPKVAVFLLLLFGLMAAAFNVSSYLYPDESNASITYENFTLNGTAYSLVRIDGTQSFLLKNGEPMSNQSKIDSVMYSYFVRSYYPNQTELDSLRGYIKKFNDSRNDGYDFKGKEEYVCRDDILLSNGKITVSGKPVRCLDNESCQTNAMLLFSVYGEGLGLGSPTAILQPLLDFTPSSLRMDELLSNYTTRLDNLNDSNVADTINYIEQTSPELKSLSLKIESTLFRTPRLNDTQDRTACNLKCWAICPSFDLDQDAADHIKTVAAALADKIEPLSDYKDNSALLYNQTVSRLEHVRNVNMETYYSDLFSPLNQSGAQTIDAAQDLLVHVENKSLSSALDDLKSLHATIPEDIANHNFTDLDPDIQTYQQLADQVDNMTATLGSEYNKTRNAKNVENSLILVLESKDLDPITANSLELLKNQSEDLDAQFHDGLSLAKLKEIGENYSKLTEKGQELLKSESDTPTTRVLLLFRGFARKVNSGIAQVAERTDVITPSDIPDSPVTLGVFSAIVFLSSASLVLLVFLYIISFSRFTIPKTTHILGAAFLSIIVLLFIFSLFMYLFLGKTSTDATLPEFLADFNSKGSTAILLDLRNASFSDAQAMRSCAASLADSFEAKNKSWQMYSLTPSTCTLTDSLGGNSSIAVSDCLSSPDEADSSFVLGYSASNEPPKFSVIYQNKAEISANLDYYESCPLVALFS